MPIVELADLTSEEVKRLDRGRTCVVLALSPVEEHGPCLPLGTDVIAAAGLARRVCERALRARPGTTFLLHPAVPLGADVFRYPGSVEIRPSTLRAVVEDVALSFARHGFRDLIVASHHGGPRHNLALDAGARAARRGGARVLSLSGRTIVDLYFRGGLRAFYEGRGIAARERAALDVDCHAGAFETAEVLALRPDLVRAGWRDLEPVLVPLTRITTASAAREGRGLGYFGAPALATAELGEDYLDFVAGRVMPDVLRFLGGEEVPGIPLRWRLALAALEVAARVREAVRGLGEGAR